MSALLLTPDGGAVVQAFRPAEPRLQAYAATPSRRESEMKAHDPYGFGVTVISMSVVISALAVLCVVFFYLGKGLSSRSGAKVRAVAKPGKGAVIAAIALALHEHSQLSRDEEIVNITIEQISRRYSPWSNRIYGVMASRLQRR